VIRVDPRPVEADLEHMADLSKVIALVEHNVVPTGVS
jgi:hypothetical protein